MNSASLTVGRVLRIVAAIAILISGIVHLDIYFNQGYRLTGLAPNANFGRSILLNAIGAGIVAVALIARREWFVRLVGVGYASSTIAIFFYTHSGGNSFLSFRHGGPVFDPSPQAQLTVIMGIVAIVALGATFVPSVDAADQPFGRTVVGVAFGVAAIALIGLTLKWKPAGSSTETVAPAAAAVEIKGFAFAAKETTVAKGTTVTWTNDDTVTHSLVATDTSFISDNLAHGGTFEFRFDTAGTFSYICGIHPSMAGTIIVTG